MRFQVFLSLWSVTSCLCIDKIPEVAKTKVSKPKRYSLLNLRLDHAPLKRLIQTRPTCLRHDVGRFAKHCPNVYAKKGGVIFILAVVLLLPLAPCPGDAVFRCESETTLFGLPKEDTARNQWLSIVFYNICTVHGADLTHISLLVIYNRVCDK